MNSFRSLAKNAQTATMIGLLLILLVQTPDIAVQPSSFNGQKNTMMVMGPNEEEQRNNAKRGEVNELEQVDMMMHVPPVACDPSRMNGVDLRNRVLLIRTLIIKVITPPPEQV